MPLEGGGKPAGNTGHEVNDVKPNRNQLSIKPPIRRSETPKESGKLQARKRTDVSENSCWRSGCERFCYFWFVAAWMMMMIIMAAIVETREGVTFGYTIMVLICPHRTDYLSLGREPVV
ncbi:hypothetical protein ZHAS_00006491 [Anopheles sinensis]|uniref:Uncharacterized protein n=1 Tax=Anopheles sinensis TaxID=74873 RepID=A0A084VMG2_ANOSI|nr:hypothetical protein ZHAS_00006491 [Anopheles sinensis]